MSAERKEHAPQCTLCNDTGYVHKNVHLGGARKDFGIESSPCKNPACGPKARRTVEAAKPEVSVSDLLKEEMRRSGIHAG